APLPKCGYRAVTVVIRRPVIQALHEQVIGVGKEGGRAPATAWARHRPPPQGAIGAGRAALSASAPGETPPGASAAHVRRAPGPARTSRRGARTRRLVHQGR